MIRLMSLAVILLMAGCSQFQTTPQPPPPATATAQEITRAQSLTLHKLGSITAHVRGSPDDAERAIAAKANEAGAPWYRIQMISETVMPGYWYASALLYGPSAAASRTEQ